jgi:hypothetical protein
MALLHRMSVGVIGAGLLCAGGTEQSTPGIRQSARFLTNLDDVRQLCSIK